MPRRLQVEFSGVVQRHTDAHGGEMSAADIWRAVLAHLPRHRQRRCSYVEHHLFEHGKAQGIRLTVEIDGTHASAHRRRQRPDRRRRACLAQRSASTLQVRSYEERSMGASGEGGDAQACAFMEVARPASERECYGVGIDAQHRHRLDQGAGERRQPDGTIAANELWHEAA